MFPPQIDQRAGVLNPHGMSKLRINTNLDMEKRFKDILHILVTEGADIDVQLQAMGVGNTVVCEELKSGAVEFSNQFTGRPFSRIIILRNMDR